MTLREMENNGIKFEGAYKIYVFEDEKSFLNHENGTEYVTEPDLRWGFMGGEYLDYEVRLIFPDIDEEYPDDPGMVCVVVTKERRKEEDF